MRIRPNNVYAQNSARSFGAAPPGIELFDQHFRAAADLSHEVSVPPATKLKNETEILGSLLEKLVRPSCRA